MSYNKQLCYNDLTQNHEGVMAWRMTPEWELYTTVVTTMGTEDKFYESGDDRVRRIADLVRKVDAEFVAQLAVYARVEMHLRSVPLLLLVELANCHRGDSLVSRAVSRTVQRADEITELLMCYQWRMGKENLHGLSSQLRKGLAEAFNRFDEYQFAKYNRTDRKVTLRDALLLVHPKPKNAAQGELFRKILNGNLETPYTWETELSAVGQQKFYSAEARDQELCDTWQELIKSGRLGYMAMLRNLSNMTNLCIDDECKQIVCDRLSDEEAVHKGKQLPFRYLAAYLQLVKDQFPFVFDAYDYWALQISYELSCKSKEIQNQINTIRSGRVRVNTNKVRRYKMRKALVNNAKIKGIQRGKLPTWHVRRRVKQSRYKEGVSMKELRKLQKLERMLSNINKRLSALKPKIARQHMRANNVFFAKTSSNWYRKLMKSCKSEWKRRDRKMELMGTNKPKYVAPFLEALEKAVRNTVDHISGFDENTRVLLASDISGSMIQPVSGHGSVTCYHIGLLLSMLLQHRCKNVVAGMFGTDWKTYDFSFDDVLRNTFEMITHAAELGSCTNGYKAINWLIHKKRVMDKVMIFTDCELWDSHLGANHLSESWERYKRMAPDAKLYVFNLAGYGTNPVSMKRGDVFCIAGWSDKVFDVLYALENGENAIDMIRRIVV